VIATIGDVGIRRWSLGNLRPDSPPIAGAAHESFAFPFTHSYGQCGTATCLMSGSKVIIHRGGIDRDVFQTTIDENSPSVSFDLVPQGPVDADECWPIAYDGERIVFLSNRRNIQVWKLGILQSEFNIGTRANLGLMHLVQDRMVGILNGRLVVWKLGTMDGSEKQIGPHYHGWRRQVLHFCLSGTDPSHVALVTLGSDRTVCFFEGPLDNLVFQKRVSISFARFHYDLPYFLRILNDAIVFNDDCGVYIVDL